MIKGDGLGLAAGRAASEAIRLTAMVVNGNGRERAGWIFLQVGGVVGDGPALFC